MSKLKKHVRNYTSVANDIINDDRLSLKAKGLYLYLVSKPDNWNFSARLIATQNNDQKASINSALHELENFGLLVRVPCQGGYDYDLFDKIKVTLPKIGKVKNHSHFTENRQSTLPKIHSFENRQSISNKEPKVKREERDNDFNPPSLSHALDVVDLNDYLIDKSYFNFIEEFVAYVSSKAKNPISYSASVRLSLLVSSNVNHQKTLLAYSDFEKNRPDLKQNGVLPVGVNIFDVIGRD